MAIEDLPNGVRPFARPFSLVRPPRDRQFRTAQLKVERSQRKAQRRLEAKLDNGDPGDAVRAVNIVELANLWGSFGYRELREDLSPQEAEQLPRQLAGFLAGEVSLAAWHATILALREVRRADELPVGARSSKWRQSWPDLNGW
jgi:hypothetical protein